MARLSVPSFGHRKQRRTSARSDVVHNTGTAVVVFVGHALLLRRVGLDVDNVSNMELAQVGRGLDGAVVLKSTGEHVARTRAETERVRHAGSSLPGR